MQPLENAQSIAFVADTMAVVLHLENRAMPASPKFWFKEAEQAPSPFLGIPAMVLAEIGYLQEKNRIKLSVNDVLDYVSRHPGVQVLPLTASVIRAAFGIANIPELHDRLIAGTALSADAQLLTNDPVIIASGAVKTLWL